MSYGKATFRKGKHAKTPIFPDDVPGAEEFPKFTMPEAAGKGRFKHWTEGPKIQKEVRRFVKDVLEFRKPVIRTHFRYTGNVDMVAVDEGRKGKPCARFEIKSAKEYVTDVHAKKKKRRRKPPRRAGRFEINPAQHFQSREGVCDLFYVLVPVKGKRVQRVGVCTLPMIETAIETEITKRRPVHREVAWRCPTVKQWVEWKRR